MPVTLFPFSAFIPDGSAYGRELDRFENVLPIHGGARSLREKQAVASVADGPMLGAHVHIYQQSTAEQHARPAADTTVGIWLPNTGTTLATQIDEEVPSDGDLIYAAGAPSAEVVKIDLSDIETPAAGTRNIKWRYRIQGHSGANWTLKLELVEGSTVRDTITVTGSADTDFVERTDATAPAVTDWSNLFFQWTATVPGAASYLRPTSDQAFVGWWETEAGGSTDLYAGIDESSADDADYAISQPIAAGQTTSYTVALGSSSQYWVAKTHTVRYRYRATNAGMDLAVVLLQGTTEIASWSHASVSTSFATAAQALTSDQRLALKALGYTSLALKFTASYPAAIASTVSVDVSPDGDVENAGEWGATTPGTLYDDVDEATAGGAGDNDLIWSDDAVDPWTATLSLPAQVDPLASDGHVLKVRAKRSGALNGTLYVELLQGGATILFTTAGADQAGAAFATFTYTLSAAQANAISDYGDLQVRFTAWDEPIQVSWVQFALPLPRRMIVSWAELELPSTARAEVTYAELVTPATDTTYRGDRPTIFCGSREKLYEAATSGFTDLSKAGTPAYGAAGSAPGSWYFASWGNHVVATNYIDPVQYRANNTGDFADLFTSTLKPKARFVAAARSHLMIGAVNEALANHFSDEVWWSAFEDIADIDPDTATQCDYQRLVSTPGQLMGLVGGDDVLAFKRRSLYRLMWVGGQLVWQPELLSNSVGTPYPRSIVQGQGEVFFWGGESFYRLPRAPGAAPTPLGKGVIARMLTDTEYSDAAIKQATPAGMKEEDQFMVGAWCGHSGLLVWTYQGKDDSEWRHSRAVCYNPDEDRWSVWNIAGADLAALFSQPNTIDDSAHELKGLLGLDWDGTNSRWFRYDSGTIYEAVLRSKTFPIAMEQDGRPKLVRLKGVLPIFTGAALGAASYPDITVRVESGRDPRFVDSPEDVSYTASASSDDRQWLPFDQEGYWFRITATIPTATNKAMRTFDGVYLQWELRGS